MSIDALAEEFDTPRPIRARYAQAPLLAIWEVSQACDLACIHCRACAQPERDPGELSHEEGLDLLRQIREMGTRLVVFTGGDPLKRTDLFPLMRAARDLGIVPSLSPSVTPLLNRSALLGARRAGVSSISLSLDGAEAATHDRFRGIPGAYSRTIQCAGEIRELDIELRINTTVTSRNLSELRAIADIVGLLEAKVWSVFFLVPTGRASGELQISPRQCEEVLEQLYELSTRMPFRIKTTEAPHYRRIVTRAMSASAMDAGSVAATASGRSGGGRFAPGLNDGNGFVFISHTGEVYPSGFLPLSAGNVRDQDLSRIYRHSPIFRALRDPDRLKGRCGRCPYRGLCGGSRARAYAETGDPLEEDSLCAFVPGGDEDEENKRFWELQLAAGAGIQ